MFVRVAAIAAAALFASSAAYAGRVGTAHVTVDIPPGWHTWIPPKLPTEGVIDPKIRVVAISAPFRFAATACQIAAYSFPSTAVALVVVEWTTVLRKNSRWPPRPSRFDATTLPLHPAPAIECFGGPGGSVEFQDHGRDFGAYVLAGNHATRALVARARAVLQTLHVGT